MWIEIGVYCCCIEYMDPLGTIQTFSVSWRCSRKKPKKMLDDLDVAMA